MTDQPLLIAEAGVNHNGDPETALRLVDAAKDAGADFVKFQTFRAEALASRSAPKARYQTRTTPGEETQVDMLRKLELSEEAHHRIAARCAERGIGFLSTPFDLPSLWFLVEELGVKTLKFGSGEILNAPLLLEGARTGKPILLSTGMSNLEEIRLSLGVLAFGYLGGVVPSRKAFEEAWALAEGKAAVRENVTLLQCTTQYPAPVAEANLRAMATMREAFGVRVGYSDHTLGHTACVAATALGAVVIEKHFTLDKSAPGPDHAASADPGELAALAQAVRDAWRALGSGEKFPSPSELENRSVARKSLVAARAMAKGELVTEEAIAVKRPGGGLSPHLYWDVVGKRAARDLEPDQFLEVEP